MDYGMVGFILKLSFLDGILTNVMILDYILIALEKKIIHPGKKIYITRSKFFLVIH